MKTSKTILLLLISIIFIQCNEDNPDIGNITPPILEENFTDTVRVSKDRITEILSNVKENQLNGAFEFNKGQLFDSKKLGKKSVIITPDSIKIEKNLSFKIIDFEGYKLTSNIAEYYIVAVTGQYVQHHNSSTYYAAVLQLKEDTLFYVNAGYTTIYNKSTEETERGTYYYILEEDMDIMNWSYIHKE